MTQAQTEARKRKERSPSYPAIDLEVSIERARQIREHEGRHLAPVEAILKHWGYSAKSSGGLVTLAALKKFGLLEDQGSGERRQARVTPLALKILLDDRPDSRERLAAIKEAALMPPIHAELWQEFDGSLPSDATLKYQLRAEKGFTDTAAAELIEEFRRTISFARLVESDTISGYEEDILSPEEEHIINVPGTVTPQAARGDVRMGQRQSAPFAPSTSPSHERVPLRLLGGKTSVIVELPHQMSEKAWMQMMDMLNALKPGYVAEDDSGEA